LLCGCRDSDARHLSDFAVFAHLNPQVFVASADRLGMNPHITIAQDWLISQ
jgi:hypothetical protein